jgi:hypothetical protein
VLLALIFEVTWQSYIAYTAGERLHRFNLSDTILFPWRRHQKHLEGNGYLHFGVRIMEAFALELRSWKHQVIPNFLQ